MCFSPGATASRKWAGGGGSQGKGAKEARRDSAGPCLHCRGGDWVPPAAPTLRLPHQPGPQGKGPGGEGTPDMSLLPVLLLTTVLSLTNSNPMTKPVQESVDSFGPTSGCVRVSSRSYPVNVTRLETWLGFPSQGQAASALPQVRTRCTLWNETGGFKGWKMSYH